MSSHQGNIPDIVGEVAGAQAPRGSPAAFSTTSSLTSYGTRNAFTNLESPTIPAQERHIDDALPGYLIRPVARLERVELSAVAEEEAEEGDGDSVVDGDDSDLLDDALTQALLDRCRLDEDDNAVDDCDRNSILLNNPDIRLPGPPHDWEAPQCKTAEGEPAFSIVDNPGSWCEYTFRPEFDKKTKQYIRHTLPTGAMPVEPTEEGRRSIGEWDFYYNGWERIPNAPKHQSGATGANLFPDSQKGQLDATLLQKLGLTQARMVDCDALFFHQLLLPMCNPRRSGIDGDPRLPFYSNVEIYSNLYALQIGLGGSYGHSFKMLTLDELVHFDGVVIRDGVRGGSSGAIHRRWMEGRADYNEQIDKVIRHCRWLQIKRVIKLCDNTKSGKRGDEGYDPAYKYDMLYDVVIKNVNALTKWAELDICGDETTWGHEGFAETGTGISSRILGKPGITKGGQTVIVSDIHRIRPRAYVHHHKLHEKEPGWTTEGPNEVKMIMAQILPMVVGQVEVPGTRQIFQEKPHSTWDNYFSGCKIFDWMGEKGFAATMTCRRDRFPKIIAPEYLHKKKTTTVPRPKAARFNKPINAVKRQFSLNNEGQKAEIYECVHVSFQSTSSCNISTVNALNACTLSCRRKERGRGANKRHWAIEMNNARNLYLGTYFRIDVIDHLIKNAKLFYRSWKYWHLTMLHGKGRNKVWAHHLHHNR